MKKIIIILLFLQVAFPINIAWSQDSTRVLSFEAFYQIVRLNHPIVKQAGLLSEMAAQDVRFARGSFDPKIEGSWNSKDFNDTEYYDILDISLKVPLWFPVDPVAGIERNRGTFLNPENYISENTDNQQLYYGVSIPIGQGLFIDERRATIKKSLIMQNMAEAERVKEINKVLLTAAKDYWDWFFAYRKYELMQQNIAVAEDIFTRTIAGFTFGEVAAIDTVQAKISLLTRMSEFQQANIDLIQTALKLSNHLWDEEGIPLELSPEVVPVNRPMSMLPPEFLNQLVEMARSNHPEIRKLDLKRETLIVDQQLARENLKPRLDLSYYLLDQPWNAEGRESSINLNEDYKVGVNVAFPLFLRKERAKLGQVRLYMSENTYQQEFTEREIVNQINSQFLTLTNLQDLLEQQQAMVDNYELLLAAERINLENGESDLFKINIQLEKLIESQEKLLKSESAYQKDLATLFWAAGVAHITM